MMQVRNYSAHNDRAQQIVEALPTGPYQTHYQPTYPDRAELTRAVSRLLQIPAATSTANIREFRENLVGIQTGELDLFLLIGGNCTRQVVDKDSIQERVDEVVYEADVFASTSLSKRLDVTRYVDTKPRSSPTETLPGDEVVLSYMGDAINSKDPRLRTPDPWRMPAAARQAMRVESKLREKLGHHHFSAREAMLFAYEEAFREEDPETGLDVIKTADLLWLGYRTYDPDGPHAAMLSSVENAVGAKVGSNTTPEHIKALNERLNPKHELGKLVLMPRLGSARMHLARDLFQAIKVHAPTALIVPDYVHGETFTTEGGVKTRLLADILKGVRRTYEVAEEVGVEIVGAHLETMADEKHSECIEQVGQEPSRRPLVDPQLNPRQTRIVADAIATHHR